MRSPRLHDYHITHLKFREAAWAILNLAIQSQRRRKTSLGVADFVRSGGVYAAEATGVITNCQDGFGEGGDELVCF